MNLKNRLAKAEAATAEATLSDRKAEIAQLQKAREFAIAARVRLSGVQATNTYDQERLTAASNSAMACILDLDQLINERGGDELRYSHCDALIDCCTDPGENKDQRMHFQAKRFAKLTPEKQAVAREALRIAQRSGIMHASGELERVTTSEQ